MMKKLLLVANLVVALTLQALTTHEADVNPTWEAGGGGPGGLNGQVQYRVNSKTFGGITNATSNGTTITLTSPKIVTNILDANANTLLGVTAIASAVNNVTLSNAATGEMPTLSVSGNDSNVPLSIRPKGTSGFIRIGPDTYGASGWDGSDVGLEYYQASSPTGSSSGIYVEDHLGDFADASAFGVMSNVFTTNNPSATQNVSLLWAVNGNAYSYVPFGHAASEVKGVYGYAAHIGTGTATSLFGIQGVAELFNNGTTNSATGVGSTIIAPYNSRFSALFSGSVISNNFATGNTLFGLYTQDLSGASYPYFLWYDSPGVFDVKGDGAMEYYNPAFTKYSIGASNYERAVQRWNGNTLEYGTQAGGTGTLRPVKILGSALTTPDLISTGVVGATSGFTGPAGVVHINDVVALPPSAALHQARGLDLRRHRPPSLLLQRRSLETIG